MPSSAPSLRRRFGPKKWGMPGYPDTRKSKGFLCQAQPLSAFVLPENGPQNGQWEVAVRRESCSSKFEVRPGPLEGVRSKGKRFLFLEAGNLTIEKVLKHLQIEGEEM